jgi:hypothetical protein
MRSQSRCLDVIFVVEYLQNLTATHRDDHTMHIHSYISIQKIEEHKKPLAEEALLKGCTYVISSFGYGLL